MRPTREAFEEALTNFASDYSALEEAFLHGDSDVHERRAEKAKSKSAVLDVYDAQEAQIRELADALSAFLVLRAGDRIPDGAGPIFDKAREVLQRARGAS